MAMNSRRSSELNVLPARRVSTHKTPSRSFCQESGAYIAQVVCIPMRLRAPMSLEAAAAGFQTTAEVCWSTCSASSMLAEGPPAGGRACDQGAFDLQISLRLIPLHARRRQVHRVHAAP